MLSTVLLFSGGLKSTVLYYHLKEEYPKIKIHLLTFMNRNNNEIISSTKLIQSKIIDLSNIPISYTSYSTIMLALAISYAEILEDVFYVSHGPMEGLYAERKKKNMHISIYNPFNSMTMAEIIRLGYRLNTPMQQTFSCQTIMNNNGLQCGVCKKCIARREGFQIAGIRDNTVYQGNTR